MKTVELELPEDIIAKLEKASAQLGISPEQLLRLSVEEKLTRLDDEFDNAADYVLRKNAELYKRLA
ncbi:MAG TPA: CopG family transcriptional regulator [Blastocatellia bacterium]|nr:CopG family transcriptional regulator [Blastocatellia bacterium]